MLTLTLFTVAMRVGVTSMKVMPISKISNNNAVCIREVLRQPISGHICAFMKENIKIPAPAPEHDKPFAMGR